MATKYYAVVQGKEKGIFHSWEDCKESVMGYKGAVYKSFKTEEEAKTFILNDGVTSIGDNKKSEYAGLYTISNLCNTYSDKSKAIAFLDCTCDKSKGICSYSYVIVFDGITHECVEYSTSEDVIRMGTIGAEILGVCDVVKLAYDAGVERLDIHYKNDCIGKWYYREYVAHKDGGKKLVKYLESVNKHMPIELIKQPKGCSYEIAKVVKKLNKTDN